MTSASTPSLLAWEPEVAVDAGAGWAAGNGSGSGGRGAIVALGGAGAARGAPQRSQNLAPGTQGAPQDSQKRFCVIASSLL